MIVILIGMLWLEFSSRTWSWLTVIQGTVGTRLKFSSTILQLKTNLVIDDGLIMFEKDALQRRGVTIHDAIEHCICPTACEEVRGLHVRSKSSLPSKAQLISLPKDYTLSAFSGQPPDNSEIWSEITESPYRLGVQLLQEWHKTSSSSFNAYINMLPPPNNSITPIHWPEGLLDKFPYTALVLAVKAQKTTWQAVHTSVTTHIPALQGVSFQRVVWALEAVTSRAFQGEEPSISTQQKAVWLGIGIALLSLSMVAFSQHFIDTFPTVSYRSDNKVVIHII